MNYFIKQCNYKFKYPCKYTITQAKSFAIEDIEYSDDLLKLEGGQEAFKKRENKYGI